MMPTGASILRIAACSTALALPSALAAKESSEAHPPRFQVDGWKSTCWPGTDGFAANCEATKKVAGYVLRLAVDDDQFFQFIDHAGCESQQNNVFREDAFAPSESAQRKSTVKIFERLARHMERKCPKLPRLSRDAFRHPPNLNEANADDVR